MRALSVLGPLALTCVGVVFSSGGCVSDAPPASPDGGDGGTTNGEGGTPDGSTVATKTCTLSPNTIKKVSFVPAPNQVDTEHGFVFFHTGQGANSTILWAYKDPNNFNATFTFNAATINITDGNPSVPAPQTMISTFQRLLGFFRGSSSVGVIGYEKVANYGFTILKVSDTDLLSMGTSLNFVANVPHVDVPPEGMAEFSSGDSAEVIPLDTSDYFLVGFATTGDKSKYKRVSARLTGMAPPVVQIQSESQHNLNALVQSNATTAQAFVSVDGQSGSTGYVFDLKTAAFQKTTMSPELVFSAAPDQPDNGYAITSAQVDKTGIVGFHLGVVSSLEAIDTSKLTLLSGSNVDIGPGLSAGWWTPNATTPPSFILVGPTATSMGATFMWIDSHGNLLAQATGANKILANVPNVAGAAAVIGQATIGQEVAITWVERNQSGDTINYGKLICR